jgi:uncharacterized membrane protein
MIKFTEEELGAIKSLNEKNRAVTLELGEIELAKLKLEERRKFAEEYLANLRTEQEANGKALTEKYGNGSIDLETGEFTPVQE